MIILKIGFYKNIILPFLLNVHTQVALRENIFTVKSKKNEVLELNVNLFIILTSMKVIST